MPGVFAQYQPLYARCGIATFPVTAEKSPAVKHFTKIGLPASAAFALRFTEAPGIGFVAGRRSGLTIVDVDSPDEAALQTALKTFGDTPLISRTGSGHWHAWYRHGGEKRQIRLMADPPVDLLGGGLVIAPPSNLKRGSYAFYRGGLSNIADLPYLRLPKVLDPAEKARPKPQKPKRAVGGGERNNALFKACMREAPNHTTAESLILWAQDWNERACTEPLGPDEVRKTASSAWRYEADGRNWIAGAGRLTVSYRLIDDLASKEPDALALFMILKRNHSQRQQFAMAKSHAKALGWGEHRYRHARAVLEKCGHIVCLNRGGQGPRNPPLYRFG